MTDLKKLHEDHGVLFHQGVIHGHSGWRDCQCVLAQQIRDAEAQASAPQPTPEPKAVESAEAFSRHMWKEWHRIDPDSLRPEIEARDEQIRADEREKWAQRMESEGASGAPQTSDRPSWDIYKTSRAVHFEWARRLRENKESAE